MIRISTLIAYKKCFDIYGDEPEKYCITLEGLERESNQKLRQEIFNSNLMKHYVDKHAFISFPGLIKIYVNNSLLDVEILEVEVFWGEILNFINNIKRNEKNLTFSCYPDDIEIHPVTKDNQLYFELFSNRKLLTTAAVSENELESLLLQAKNTLSLIKELYHEEPPNFTLANSYFR